MRQKRAKAYRKLMALYSMSFGFRQPYQILVDSEMCKTAADLKIELVKQFGVVLQGTVKPMITQCCIHELYLQGKAQQAAVDLAKTFERRKCNHREAIPGDDCLSSVVGDSNKHRYVIATQSQPLRVKLRSIPAVPIVHVNRSVMVLEPPSDATLRSKTLAEEKGLHATAPDMALVPPTPTSETPRKRKGPKGPNPLSVMKKKKPLEPSKKQGASLVTMGGRLDRVGEKRKREAEILEAEDNRDHNDEDHEKQAGGRAHKRKRRKKNNASTN